MAKTKANNKNKHAVKFQPVPREAHDHLHNQAVVRGNRIRFRCGCGAATKWRPMTDNERRLYKSVVSNTLEHVSIGFNSESKEGTLKLPKRKARNPIEEVEPAKPNLSDVR